MSLIAAGQAAIFHGQHRLYRQPEYRNWVPVFEENAADLEREAQ